MFDWATRSVCWLGIVLIAASAAQAQGPASNAKVITWNPSAGGEICVGVLGEISKPGVYRLDPQSLNVQAVIRRAGGLTDNASGTIRVLRQERMVESLYFSPQTNSPLLANDLLVIESKQTQAAISRLYKAESTGQSPFLQQVEPAAGMAVPDTIHLAFVNVLDRPVIVKIKHENAHVANLVQMLDQPIELAQSVRVIGSERLSPSGAAQPAIVDGSVLVFPRNSINRSKLPPLPIPYDSEIASGAVPSLIGGQSGQSPELRNVGQLPPLVAQEPVPPATAYPPSSAELNQYPAPPDFGPAAPAGQLEIPPAASEPSTIQLPATQPPADQMPMVSSPPRIATIPFDGQSRITSSSQISTTPETAPVPAADGQGQFDSRPPERSATAAEPGTDSGGDRFRPQSNAADRAHDDELLDDEDLFEDDPEPEPGRIGSSLSLLQMLGISACIGLLIGLALLTRRQLNRRAAMPPSLQNEIESALQRTATPMPVEPEPIVPEPIAQNPIVPDPIAPDPIAQNPIAQNPIAQDPASTAPAAVDSCDAAVAPRPASLAQTIAASSTIASSSKMAPPPKTAPSPKPAPSSKTAARLDQLLANQLPIREEAPDFPREIILQGRIAAPPVLRVDPPQSAPLGPHFGVPRSEADTAAATMSDTDRSVEEIDAPHIGPAKPHFLRRRAGENTIAAASMRAGSGHARQADPIPSATPVTDALRQLQGGQP